jgi:nuclear pore complex protein Nup155
MSYAVAKPSTDGASSSSLPEDDRFFSTLARASNTIKGFLEEDARWGDLSDQLSAAQYQYKLQLVSPWAPIERQRVLSIPDAVIEASSSAETFASQGLFPEIERAWIVIDTRLYLWNYLEASSDAFESYEHPERVIQAVGLVRPKSGVFIDSIQHVLVVCTSSSITLLGLAVEDKTASSTAPSTSSNTSSNVKGKQLKLFVTEMNVQTEGIQMSDVCGTGAGRIFCKGNDGCLYEVLYQASEGWFSNRCSLRNVTSPRLSNLVPSFIQGKQKGMQRREDGRKAITKVSLFVLSERLDYVCVDSLRNIVYTLHKGTEIEIHHLPSLDSSKAPVQIARAKDICRHANMICPNTTLLQPNEFLITWMMPLAIGESKSVHLVAVTSKGVRLYFTNQRGGWRALSGYASTSAFSSADSSVPTCLELIYVRPPPPAGQTQSAEGGMTVQQSQQSQQQQQQQNMQASAAYQSSFSNTDFAPHQPLINGVNHAYYSDGIFLAGGQYSLEPTGALDCILCVNRAIPSTEVGRSSAMTTVTSGMGMGGTPASHSGTTDLADTATDLIVQGATWAINEVSRKNKIQRPEDRLHPLALQMLQPPRVFLVLTSSGLFVLIEQRPIDTLKGLLQVGTLYDQTVHEFFKRFGQSQSCAMSLAIASQNSLLTIAPESHLSSTKTQDEVPRLLSQDVVSHAWRIYFDFGGHPRYEPPPYPSQPASDGKVTLSGRHDGLAIYLCRLLRPFWNQAITRRENVPGEGVRQNANIQSSVLVGPQRELQSLRKFLDQNSQLFGLGNEGPGGASRGGGSNNRGTSGSIEGDQIALTAEKDSFDAIRTLLSRSLEAISFVLLLIDYKLPNLVQRCRPEIQNNLINLTFADLVTTRVGRDVGRSLVEAVIDLQISSQVNVDVVADVLQERCGGFCNSDDVRLYKALECIRRAKEAAKVRDEHGKVEALKESLRLLNRATGNLPMEKLEGVCQSYRELKFIHGAIELPLQCVANWDKARAAEAYRAQGMPENDPRKGVYDLSIKCYGLVLETLESLESTSQASNGTAVTSTTSADQNAHLARELEDQRINAYQQAQASTDALFHVAMYDWLLSRHKTDELLRIRSPYVEDYLRSEPITLQRCLLLCLWYVSVGENFSAAQLYAGLAQSTELDITLEDRMEYLTKASGNAKSTFQHSQELINFINDIDEKLEVASIQIEVYKSVQESMEIEEEHKVMLMRILNDNLLDVTQLYRDFAEPLQMHEVKLFIYHVSDHRDLDLVRMAWQALIAEGEYHYEARLALLLTTYFS